MRLHGALVIDISTVVTIYLPFHISLARGGSRFCGAWSLYSLGGGGPSLRKRIQNYAYTTRYGSEYLFRIRKEITNFKFRKADKYYRYHKLQKNNQIFLVINFWRSSKITFSLHFLIVYPLITSSYDNNILNIIFCRQNRKTIQCFLQNG